MRSIACALALLVAAPLLAADTPRNPLPDDYVPQSCAPRNTCVTYPRASFIGAAARERGITGLEDRWVTAHWDEMVALLSPFCTKSANCFATPGATFTFCNDIVMPDMRTTCDRFSAESNDRRQCLMFVEVFALGRDQQSGNWWREAQACTKKSGTLVKKSYAPVVWTVPAQIPLDYKGRITFYALDPQTKLPVQALVSVEGQTLYSSAPARGLPTTYYGFTWPVKMQRVANAEGHQDVVAPLVTVASDWYEPVTLPMPVALPTIHATMTPRADKLRPGKNTVTVTTVDSATGKPIESRVMLGELVLGEANTPLTIELPKNRKHDEIWVTSLFNAFNDIVVAPAKK